MTEKSNIKERGATMVEYAMLLSTVMLTVLASTHVMGVALDSNFARINEEIAAPAPGYVDPASTTTVPAPPSGGGFVPPPTTAAPTTTTTTTTTTTVAPSFCKVGFELVREEGRTKKNGKSVDKNGDGFICRKATKNGGNTGKGESIRDNKFA